MAKTCSVQRNKKRMLRSAATRIKRLALKKTIKKGSPEECDEAMLKLMKTQRDESPCRVRRRCRQCGRPHGVYRKFGLCRICLRNAIMKYGDVPGLRKASW